MVKDWAGTRCPQSEIGHEYRATGNESVFCDAEPLSMVELLRDLEQSPNIFLRDGPQIRQSQNEETVGSRTAKDRTECGEGTVGKAEGS